MGLADVEDTGREERLHAAVAACLEAVASEPAVDRQQVLARYPEFAADLEELFAGRDQFDGLAAPMRQVAQAASTSAAATVLTRGPGANCRPAMPGFSFGDYEILEEIGRGGMGVIYRARQKSLDRLVALKMVR